ncbi:MAG TPA: diol dehydratase small subunit [Kineosporiaceae bacterium]|nr:diol dehydratase small subunit [Kineosporiaceae bacterium]
MVTTVDLDAVRAGRLSMADVAITPATLRRQAEVARTHANPQLGENFERAAELTSVPDAELLAIYEQLRPHRATAEQLEATAVGLQARGAVQTAASRTRAAVYTRRGLLRAQP